MAQIILDALVEIDGFVAAALVDTETGLILARQGGLGFDLQLAARGNAEIVRAKRKVAAELQLNDHIEDILMTLGKQYHLIRPLQHNNALFLYLVLERSTSSLAMARHELKNFEKTLGLAMALSLA